MIHGQVVKRLLDMVILMYTIITAILGLIWHYCWFINLNRFYVKF